MSECLRLELLDFAVEDVNNIIEAIEEIRITLVRLERRNRLRKEDDIRNCQGF